MVNSAENFSFARVVSTFDRKGNSKSKHMVERFTNSISTTYIHHWPRHHFTSVILQGTLRGYLIRLLSLQRIIVL